MAEVKIVPPEPAEPTVSITLKLDELEAWYWATNPSGIRDSGSGWNDAQVAVAVGRVRDIDLRVMRVLKEAGRST